MRLEKWALIAEITSGIAIVATLIILIVEVHESTSAIDRVSAQARAARLIDPYLHSPQIPTIYAKLKANDGATEAAVEAFADNYDLTVEESVLWVRHLEWIWTGLQSDYLYTGPSELLDHEIRDLMNYPDERIFWEHTADYWLPDFVSYVNGLSGGE